MNYYKCTCGSADFIRVYNVFNERIRINVINEGKDCEKWNIEERGKGKNHLDGYRCAKCGKDADELNEYL